MASCSCQGSCSGTTSKGTAKEPGGQVMSNGGDAGHYNDRVNTPGCQCASDCTGGCSNSNVGRTDNNATGGKSGSCWCGHNCAGCGGCSGKCSGCSGDCTGCSGACGGSCSGTCSNGCSYTCTGSCKGYCKGTCNDGCQGGCKTACSGECQHLCNATCISDVAAEAYEHLIHIETVSNLNYTFEEHLQEEPLILDWLDADDMRYLFGMIQEEGRRRVLKKTGKYTGEDVEHPKTIAQTLTRDEERQIGIRDEFGKIIEVKSGDFADDEKHIKKLLNMYADNTGKSISLSVGGTTIAEGNTIKKSIGRTLIEKALASYREKIAVNTTSDEGGKQEK